VLSERSAARPPLTTATNGARVRSKIVPTDAWPPGARRRRTPTDLCPAATHPAPPVPPEGVEALFKVGTALRFPTGICAAPGSFPWFARTAGTARSSRCDAAGCKRQRSEQSAADRPRRPRTCGIAEKGSPRKPADDRIRSGIDRPTPAAGTIAFVSRRPADVALAVPRTGAPAVVRPETRLPRGCALLRLAAGLRRQSCFHDRCAD
jgi:hypothetical protein